MVTNISFTLSDARQPTEASTFVKMNDRLLVVEVNCLLCGKTQNSQGCQVMKILTPLRGLSKLAWTFWPQVLILCPTAASPDGSFLVPRR